MTSNIERLITIAEVGAVVGAAFTLSLAMASPYPVDVSGLPVGAAFIGLLIGLLWKTRTGEQALLRLLIGAFSALLGSLYIALIIGIGQSLLK